MGRVSNKVAIVTGCASDRSLGFAISRALLKEGARVVMTDVSPVVLERAAALDPSGQATIGLRHDVTNEAEWAKIVETTVGKFGGLDILVNNAGINIPGMVESMTLADFDKQMSVNVSGVFLGCKLAVPAMLKSGKGSIINISSTGGITGNAGVAGYCASKGAVRLFSKCLALEHAANGLRCNSVHPGMIDTAIHDELRVAVPDIFEHSMQSVPMRRMGTPDDIAYCVLYLASDEASYVTGAEFVIDGGWTAH